MSGWRASCTTPAPPAAPAPALPSAAQASSSAGAAPATSATPRPQRVEARYAGGQIVGGSSRTSVRLGSTVEFVVNSDVADEIHVHGYEKKANVPTGDTATVAFVADEAGEFEIELENNGVQLTKLIVS
jgi:plastocyanin